MDIEHILCVAHFICLYMEGYSMIWSHIYYGDQHGEQLFENRRLFNPSSKYLMGFEA